MACPGARYHPARHPRRVPAAEDDRAAHEPTAAIDDEAVRGSSESDMAKGHTQGKRILNERAAKAGWVIDHPLDRCDQSGEHVDINKESEAGAVVGVERHRRFPE